ncbi:hypothetical protein JCM33374_g1557 [Metschnikowia sp. JCM 33374]|nr:hypothetical protein JCM33374_g1557 [Metschnikowia sp. JCM 33374]
MGQLTSTEASKGSHKEIFSEQRIRELFQMRIASILTKGEISSIASKVNMNDIENTDAVLTFSDLAAILNLTDTEEQTDPETPHDESHNEGAPNKHMEESSNNSLNPVVEILYRSFSALGKLPFLRTQIPGSDQLTIKNVLIAFAVHMGYMSRMWPHCDYLKLVFISFAQAPSAEHIETTTDVTNEKKTPPLDKSEKEVHSNDSTHGAKTPGYTVETIPNPQPHPEEDPKITSRRIKWGSLQPLVNYNDIDMDSLSVSAYDLAQVLSLLLVVNSVPEQSHNKMQQQIRTLANEKWKSFEAAAFSVLRYLDIEITEANCKDSRITYDTYKYAMEGAMEGFLRLNFHKFVKSALLSSIVPDPQPVNPVKRDENPSKGDEKKITRPFTPTRLVDEATISLLGLFMRNIDSSVGITPQNVVELFNGAQSGFSIRSLESKIFKWQAPTIFMVSGKRLRSKTILKNKRYQQFDAEYPRHFRSSEDPKKTWQSDNDRITYAVFVKQPWKNSNKNNFGDEETAIMAISPRYDVFKSKRGLLSAGKSIYFNNQGMGVGFGNEQPVNKNNTRKYLPGTVSLTIEPNLEFGVFRHIVNAGANTPRFFETSSQSTVCNQDYEDRFVITDLEVWGVGSTKELDEQRKQWEWEEKQASARQGVNIRNLGEERAFLEMVGLVGNQGSGGSM